MAVSSTTKNKYADILNQVANSGKGQGTGSVAGEKSGAAISAKPQGTTTSTNKTTSTTSNKTTASDAISNLVNATNTIKNTVSSVGGVTMNDVVAAGQNQALKDKYAETLNQIANSGNGQGNGSVLGETGTAHIEAKPQGGGGGNGGGGGGSSTVAPPSYTAATLPSATSQADYINALYDANEAKRKAALEAQYTANVGALDRQAAGIPAQYDAAANQAAAQSAVNRASFNEMASASGLNTGATGQAALAQGNALQASISSIRQAQAEALNDVESQRVALQQQYQKAIAEAIANNEADRAAALYNEAKRVDESLVSTAVNQATLNLNAWKAMYG